MVVKADPALGIAEDTALWLDIDRGVCNGCKLMPASAAQDAPFVIVADYARWKSVIKKELDPIKGMMQNKLKLTKGNMPTIVKYVQSSRELVETTSKVGHEVPRRVARRRCTLPIANRLGARLVEDDCVAFGGIVRGTPRAP